MHSPIEYVRKLSKEIRGYLLILPLATTILLVFFYPIIFSVFYSFTSTDLIGIRYNLIGVQNYVKLMSDYRVLHSIANSFTFAGLTTGLTLLVGLFFALLVNERLRGRQILNTILVSPFVVAPAAATFIFAFMFRDGYGVINYFIELVGLTPPRSWLGDPAMAMLVGVIVSTWRFFPFTFVVILARLQIIHEDLYRAAKMDGASAAQRFRYMTLPQIKSVLFVAILLRFIWMFNHFDTLWLLTGGGPARATETLPITLYITMFGEFNMGYGASIAIVNTLIVLVAALIYFRIYNVEL